VAVIDFAVARERMINAQVVSRGLADPTLIKALREVPREAFVDPGAEDVAYEDRPLKIGKGQTISQPYIVALMISRAGIASGDAVLEIGTGSGYAAAVTSRIAGYVHTVERHSVLAEQARRRFERLGYRNISVTVGDGTRGLPQAAPYDAILVAAAAPAIPQSLKEQLDLGGRLIIPVGLEGAQRLKRITRTGPTAFEEEDLGGVLFVPLIGEQGWPEDGLHDAAKSPSLPGLIAEAAEPLPAFDDPAFGRLFDRFGSRKVVLLGESSHGTSEFYQARAAITRRLVEQHGFNIVAVEADWPDAAAIDRHVRLRPRKSVDTPFERFPTWMWRNREVSDFIGWMRGYNQNLAQPQSGAGFYGLDMYNMGGSMAGVLAYLDENDPEAAKIARERYGCLAPWKEDPSKYGRAALSQGYGQCEDAVVAQCRDLLNLRLKGSQDVGDDLLDATQNARLVAAAERYYRIMYYGGAESWNLRDRHMFETLEQILDARGAGSKAVVWAHNSHIGDARHTDMGRARNEINLGQLCRERFGEQAALIGLGTYEGEVAAASDWDEEMEIKTVLPGLKGSYEQIMHETGRPRFLLDLSGHAELQAQLKEPRLERFIGVIYRPDSERQSHYMYASLPRQFDAFVWFDKTKAVTPLEVDRQSEAAPDTFPFGL
jgi:protein-L-isoaspartate(D-aspartate) O-methyltransferase